LVAATVAAVQLEMRFGNSAQRIKRHHANRIPQSELDQLLGLRPDVVLADEAAKK